MVVARCRRWLWRRWWGGRRCKGTAVKKVVRVVTVLASDLVADGDDDVGWWIVAGMVWCDSWGGGRSSPEEEEGARIILPVECV
nr:hypothetical protein [Tanacetum cinerariifolium]